ncbi:MAG TPA: AAA family ATPase, partial [Terriglobales bacterium]|nr:AAA family ATPase [Terriglobales bacterium]
MPPVPEPGTAGLGVPLSDRSAEGVFVGRERETALLRAGLDDACSGRGRVLLVTGEPGIGKTRIINELAMHARQHGVQVLPGRCYEGEGAPPFWPWVQIVRAYMIDCDLATLRTEMGPGAADIALVFPEVRERLADLPTPSGLGSEQARFRSFDGFTTFLKHAAQRQPLMLILDDLHWADTPSLLLLQFVVREIGSSRLLIVGSYRDLAF